MLDQDGIDPNLLSTNFNDTIEFLNIILDQHLNASNPTNKSQTETLEEPKALRPIVRK